MIRIFQAPPTEWWCIASPTRAITAATLKAALWRWRFARREFWVVSGLAADAGVTIVPR